MGRTVPTFVTFLMEEEKRWAPFRRALCRDHRPAFDKLFSRAREHAQAGTLVARPVPFDAITVAILVSQEITIQNLQREVDDLTEEVRRLRETR